MKRVMILLGLIWILSGCATMRGADKYMFGKAEWYRPDTQIEFVTHPSLADLRRATPADIHELPDIMAWSVISQGKCIVHILDPQISYKPEWIGHEIAHCIYGRWHDAPKTDTMALSKKTP